MGLSFLDLHSKFHFSLKGKFFGFGWGWFGLLGGGGGGVRSAPPPPTHSPPPVDKHVPDMGSVFWLYAPPWALSCPSGVYAPPIHVSVMAAQYAESRSSGSKRIDFSQPPLGDSIHNVSGAGVIS